MPNKTITSVLTAAGMIFAIHIPAGANRLSSQDFQALDEIQKQLRVASQDLLQVSRTFLNLGKLDESRCLHEIHNDVAVIRDLLSSINTLVDLSSEMINLQDEGLTNRA